MASTLVVDRLQLLSRDANRPLTLLPLMHVGASPASAKNACYFFNRVDTEGLRFVSYHYADESVQMARFDETAAVIRFLTTGDVEL